MASGSRQTTTVEPVQARHRFGENMNIINTFRWIFGGNEQALDTIIAGEENVYTITETNDNRFAITDRHGLAVKTYARRRDAVRGANRLGLDLAA